MQTETDLFQTEPRVLIRDPPWVCGAQLDFFRPVWCLRARTKKKQCVVCLCEMRKTWRSWSSQDRKSRFTCLSDLCLESDWGPRGVSGCKWTFRIRFVRESTSLVLQVLVLVCSVVGGQGLDKKRFPAKRHGSHPDMEFTACSCYRCHKTMRWEVAGCSVCYCCSMELQMPGVFQRHRIQIAMLPWWCMDPHP